MVSSGERNRLKIDDILRDFKKKFSKTLSFQQNNTDSDIFIAESLSIVKTTTSEMDKRITVLTNNITKLLSDHDFDQADKIHSLYSKKLKELCLEIEKALKLITEFLDYDGSQNPSTYKLYKKRLFIFEKKWKKQKSNYFIAIKKIKDTINSSFEQWIDNSKQKVKISIYQLESFTNQTLKTVIHITELLEHEKVTEAQRLLKKTKVLIKNELQKQDQNLKNIPDDLIPLMDDLISKWKIQINHSKTELQKLVSTLTEETEIEIVKANISKLTTIFSKLLIKLSELYSKTKQEQLTLIEKELEDLKKKAKTEFETQKQKFTDNYKKPIPAYLSNIISEWIFKLKLFEEKFKEVTSQTEDIYKRKRIPHLLKKVQLFINQNIEALNKTLDDYKKEAMGLLKTHFNEPNKSIIQILNNQKKSVLKDFNTRENHIQLVLNRYKDYSITLEREKWNEEFKKIQNQFNEIKTMILSFLEIKDEIAQAIDCYYEMAKPAYGYKVPLSALCKKLDNFPEDKLENIFFELLSNHFITGEIDPITKLIVLAPKASEQAISEKSKTFRCTVCNLIVRPAEEEIVYCPYCNSPAHRAHLIEWIKIKGFCPNCKKEIKMI